jgi:hypothetical protein
MASFQDWEAELLANLLTTRFLKAVPESGKLTPCQGGIPLGSKNAGSFRFQLGYKSPKTFGRGLE